MINIEEVSTDLVSIVVITYNSGAFVEETLDSIASQTHTDIELIISDDCSSDNTIQVCEAWLSKNSLRFHRTLLIASSENTGTSSNCNRGANSARGKWLKFIAGDDALLPTAIADYLAFIAAQDDEYLIVHADRLDYNNTFSEHHFMRRTTLVGTFWADTSRTATAQHQFLLRDNMVSAPTVFLSRHLFVQVNGFDERIILMEDWPMWLKLTKKGFRLLYMPKATVKYRKSDSTLSSQIERFVFSSRMEVDIAAMRQHYVFQDIPIVERYLLKLYEIRAKFLLNHPGWSIHLKKIIHFLLGYPYEKYRSILLKSLIQK